MEKEDKKAFAKFLRQAGSDGYMDRDERRRHLTLELLKDKTIGAININDREIYLPVGEVKTGFSNAKYIIPYCFYLKQQVITGTLTERIPDPKFKAVCRGLAEAVL